MRLKLTKIGNSHGIRLPKLVLEQLGIKKDDELDMEVHIEDQSLVLKTIKKHPREGWGQQFKTMHQNQDDVLLDPPSDLPDSTFDQEDWEWK